MTTRLPYAGGGATFLGARRRCWGVSSVRGSEVRGGDSTLGLGSLAHAPSKHATKAMETIRDTYLI
ncbi:MAG TPA: hypothetical protein VGJ84_15585 [Polyangiaceae bacterium]